jgi:hypothetical protein
MNFRALGLAFSFGSLIATVSACGIGAKSKALQTTDFSAEGSAARKMERLKELKSSILAFSKVATDRANEDELTIPASRLYMASLIQDLKKIAPAASFAEKQKLSIGAWQEVWSDARNPNPPGQKILRPNVFQVLFEDGKGFNFGVRSITLPTGAEVIATSVIELSFEKDATKEQLNVTFEKTYTKPGNLSAEASILDLAKSVKEGTRPDVGADPERRFPRGPVGAKGPLELVYVDEEIRISQGANVFSGVVDTFVLTRVEDPSSQKE